MFIPFQIDRQTHAIADFLRMERSYLLDQWKNHAFVRQVLALHKIDPDFFVKYFGSRILDYFIGVLEGEQAVGECPAITALLMFFKRKRIRLNEVFLCCAAFKNTIIRAWLDKRGSIDDKAFDRISYVFDLNFAGVIEEYLNRGFCKAVCESKQCFALNPPQRPAASVEPVVRKAEPVVVQTSEPATVYHDEFCADEIQEFMELEDDIAAVAERFNAGTFSDEPVSKLAVCLRRYGGTILRNPDFSELGNALLLFGGLFEERSKHDQIRKNIENLSVYINCFVNDLVMWRKSLLETGIIDPHYFDQSIISGIQQMTGLINAQDESDEGYGGMEFF